MKNINFKKYMVYISSQNVFLGLHFKHIKLKYTLRYTFQAYKIKMYIIGLYFKLMHTDTIVLYFKLITFKTDIVKNCVYFFKLKLKNEC